MGVGVVGSVGFGPIVPSMCWAAHWWNNGSMDVATNNVSLSLFLFVHPVVLCDAKMS